MPQSALCGSCDSDFLATQRQLRHTGGRAISSQLAFLKARRSRAHVRPRIARACGAQLRRNNFCCDQSGRKEIRIHASNACHRSYFWLRQQRVWVRLAATKQSCRSRSTVRLCTRREAVVGRAVLSPGGIFSSAVFCCDQGG